MKKMLLIILLFLVSCGDQNSNSTVKNIESSAVEIITEKKMWIKLLQNKDKTVSIIDVNLNKAWVSFWWLVQDWKFYKKMYGVDLMSNFQKNDKIFW